MNQNNLQEKLDQLADKLQKAKGLTDEEKAALLSDVNELKEASINGEDPSAQTLSALKKIESDARMTKVAIFIIFAGLIIWVLFKGLMVLYL